MAGMIVMEVIGVIGAIIDLTGFVQDNLPSHTSPKDSKVRVAVGLNGVGGGLTHAAGNAPSVVAFNEFRDPIGITRGNPYIPDGGFLDLHVHHSRGPGQQPTTIQLRATDTDICVAYVSQTWPDGQARGWLGDMGKACDRDWYHSDIIVGNNSHKPGESSRVSSANLSKS